MILFHGSNIEIFDIDFTKCKPYKDFGKGFYLTTIKEQAIRMAQNKAALYGGKPIVTIYETDDDILDKENLNTKAFPMNPTIEWARFIVNNRNKNFKDQSSMDSNSDCKYDIVLGPVADDAIAATIRRFMGDSLDEEGLMRKLTYKKLSNQYSFHTDKAIAYLRKVGVLDER